MSNLSEIWKDIIEFEGLYQVSNYGRVKSLERTVNGRWGKTLISQKILKLKPKNNGYLIVGLSKEKQFFFLVHRLVAIHFLLNPEKKETVNHKNGIKTDNRLINLEWATHSENHKHAHRIGLKNQKGENHNGSKLRENQAIQIKYEYQGYTQKEIANIYRISVGTVSSIKNGKNWKHI